MPFGLFPTGFQRARLEDVKALLEQNLRATFGENIDLRPESVFGQFVGVMALAFAERWETEEAIYLSQDPDFAEGVQLDALAALTGITRLPALPTTAIGAIAGVEGAFVQQGAVAKNNSTGEFYGLQEQTKITHERLIRCIVTVGILANGAEYAITIDGTELAYDSDTTATANEILLGLQAALEYADNLTAVVQSDTLVLTAVDLETPFRADLSANLSFSLIASPGVFQAIETGPKLLPVGALDTIVTPVAGWQSIANYEEGLIGRHIETDIAFRARRRRSVSFTATATVDAIRSGLLDLEEVISAIVLENNDDETDYDGIPPHAIWAIVLGGDDEDIANVIFNRVAGGIGMHGSETVEVLSDSGQLYEVRFSRPADIDVYIEMTLAKAADYPGTGDEQIKEALVQYVNENVLIGDPLLYSRLYTPINSVPGHSVASLFVGLGPDPAGTTNLTAAVDEILRVDTTRIVINQA